ncbi:putative PTC7 protein phosphatase [Monoraphidium neglectum]|uniref:Protein phosphatase n=1 Tax=Monoraphidium neglectum TaxID=145388 RepID=A0A0D2JRL2_9CHLO|nr:putative PTC7 protein phosphatase [Monoraphidium neglectum]KIZ01643.1 putative PTC7 protein phosphatase [Monoraphidium neglectum]|eukprot:XP_013900662.1 putative PTC7 protein phosphatase [Monoraphidium neglectum]
MRMPAAPLAATVEVASLDTTSSLEDELNNAADLAQEQQQQQQQTEQQQQPQQQQQQQQLEGMRLRIGACCLPHPDKHHYGGEDAFFVSAAGGGALGVADGVGGWAESGINPAQYSRTLMRVACAYIEGAEGEELARAAADGATATGADNSLGMSGGFGGAAADGPGYAYAFGEAVVAAGGVSGTARRFVDPRAALDAAHRRTRCAGSATAVVLQLDGAKRRLVAANLGDSGFLVARGGAIITRSRPLQHFFDCPLQLGAYPEFVDCTDTAAQAEVYEVPLQAGDVIVAGSDGLWDNAYEHEILGQLPTSADGAQSAAEAIAALARVHASDPEFASPYTREARQQGYDLSWLDKLKGIQFKDGKLELATLRGGKQDDITVLVSVVEDPPAWA